MTNLNDSFEQKASYTKHDLKACARGELFGLNNPQLPLPNMLMFDRITKIEAQGGKYNKGQIIAELDINPDMWFFQCHFHNDPVMPGCLGLDALWQMLGFFLGWSRFCGKGRASGCGNIKFRGEILTSTKKVTYKVQMQNIYQSKKLILGSADGSVFADDTEVYEARGLKVALYQTI